MPVLLAPLIALLIRALTVMLAVKGVLFVVRIMGLLGIAFATNEYAIEPLLNQIESSYAGMPATITQWIEAFGISEVASLIVTAYTIAGAQRVFIAATRS